MPYVHRLEERFAERGLRILGIHAPELEWERDLERYDAAKQEFGVRFPSYFDSDLSWMNALGATAWPLIYIVDRDGKIRGEWHGEVHAGTGRASAIETLVDELIDEVPTP